MQLRKEKAFVGQLSLHKQKRKASSVKRDQVEPWNVLRKSTGRPSRVGQECRDGACQRLSTCLPAICCCVTCGPKPSGKASHLILFMDPVAQEFWTGHNKGKFSTISGAVARKPKMAGGGTDSEGLHSPVWPFTWNTYLYLGFFQRDGCLVVLGSFSPGLMIKNIISVAPHCIGCSESLKQVQIQRKGQIPSLNEGAERSHWRREREMRDSVVASLEMHLPHNTVPWGANMIVSVVKSSALHNSDL